MLYLAMSTTSISRNHCTHIPQFMIMVMHLTTRLVGAIIMHEKDTLLKMGCFVAPHEGCYWNTWGLKNTLGVYSIHSDNDVTPYGAQ